MSSFDNVDELTKEGFNTIIKHKDSFLKTGSIVFFDEGKDVDYVLTNSELIAIMGKGNDLFLRRRDIFCLKYQSFDFIIVNDGDMWKWKLATITALQLIEQNPDFSAWFKIKQNRKAYFSAYIYNGSDEC